MRKNLILWVLVLAMGLSACGGAGAETTVPTTLPRETVPTTVAPEAETTEPVPTETLPTEPVPTEPIPVETEPAETVPEAVLLPLTEETVEFLFMSGAGGWSTQLSLNRDGSFTGEFHDSEMGDRTEEYPNGSVYICNFSGVFTDIRQVSEYAYAMTLTDLQTEHQEGEEWIEDEIRYIASGPYGLEESTEFVLYLPDAPLDQMSEVFLFWWPYRYEQAENPRDTLDCFGILNVEMEHGFFNVT